ncbi:KAP family NTPase [Shewanella sp. SW36]|uniref:KAP family P-loop NTPase fold protein n=1 Tax=Shewanella TaxID=22 RepID=UPI0021D841CD|nr:MULTISPECIES: KAP family NTPase [Shewanella]MCU7973864.1 KAP family NTPase [Shewanella sp. SW36]MCU7989473.1 KAP family NTPase [Shewanella sp. SW1]MCU8016423.1 KAP family NTPase [Shewanella sp. SM72]MCU8051148.1 KAP family NTPase [Shewanella sp. SM43]WVI92066.1 KAP family NTPase [Shewanella oncorhynchi]
MAHQSLNDLPVLTDDFGLYTTFVEGIAEEIRQSQAPKTIAITGYWGSGKTSVLAQLYAQLFGVNPPSIKGEAVNNPNGVNPHYQGVWFEAWRYQNEPQPIIALMHTMRQSFSQKRDFFDKAGKIASVSMVAGLSVFDGVIKTLSAGMVSGLDKIQSIGDKYEKDNLLSQLSTDQINNALSTAIDHLLTDLADIPNTDRKCIIFIDDLDRCDAATAKKLLEGIKVHLNLENCIFIIAIDPAQLEASFKLEHAQLRNTGNIEDVSNHDATEYLEKLCQDAHRLPIASQQNIADFVANNLNKIFTHEHDKYSDIIAAIKAELERQNYLPANPRRLKMICNRLAAFISKTNGEAQTQYHAQSLLFLASAYVSYREIYEMLSVSAKSINDVAEFCSSRVQSKIPAFKYLTSSNTEARGAFVHPNKITEFRFASLLTEIEANGNLPAWGDYLHNLIQSYNAPTPAGAEV